MPGWDSEEIGESAMRLLVFNMAMDFDHRLAFASRWICALARKLEFIHVITMRVGRVELPENVRVYSVGKEKGYSEPRRALELYQHLFRVLRNDRIDICFSHMIPVFTVLAAPVLKLRGIPIVTWYAHPSVTWTLKLAHHLSDSMVASLESAYPYKRDKLRVIGQGIDTDIFTLDGAPPRNPPIILSVSRLSPVKDHLTLLKAAARLQGEQSMPFQVVIVGDPLSPRDQRYVKSLYELVRNLQIQEIVRFYEAVPMLELPEWYRRCTVHVNMTPTGSGDKVALEAMSCGRPCLVANEGFKDTLGRCAQDLLYRYGDADDLAKKLAVLLEMSPAERDRIGYYLRERVVQKHSLTQLTSNLVSLFAGLSGNNGKR